MLLSTVLSVCANSFAQSIPNTRAESLAGTTISLPSDLDRKAAILVLGFSKKASSETKTWADFIWRDFENDPHVVYYQMPVLEDVPSLLRGFVLQGIRKHLAPADRAHFIPIFQNSTLWKRVVHFSAADDAYVLLIDGVGRVRWRTNGVLKEDEYDKLKGCAAALQGSALTVCQ